MSEKYQVITTLGNFIIYASVLRVSDEVIYLFDDKENLIAVFGVGQVVGVRKVQEEG